VKKWLQEEEQVLQQREQLLERQQEGENNFSLFLSYNFILY